MSDDVLIYSDRPLYVRLPEREAEMLDRAAREGRTSKRQLVTSLVQRFLGEEGPLVVDGRGVAETGRHDFSAGSAPEVLTLEQAAELLMVAPEAIEELAAKGELPGRRIGGEWRFSRSALVDWLAAR
ncbi:MAG TPA: helix-turn-helix domain-containing protein [Thermoleophilaceae bacterium]